MKDIETPRMHKYGESYTTRIMMETVVLLLPALDVRNSKQLDFCWTECTIHFLHFFPALYVKYVLSKFRRIEVSIQFMFCTLHILR